MSLSEIDMQLKWFSDSNSTVFNPTNSSSKQPNNIFSNQKNDIELTSFFSKILKVAKKPKL